MLFREKSGGKIVTKVQELQALSGDFQCVCGKMHAQILLGVRWCAISIFFFLKFYNFIKGIMLIHSFLKKPKTNVFMLHLLQLATEQCKASKVWKKVFLFFLYTLYKARRKLESSFSHSFLAVFPSLVMQRISSFIL